MSSRRSPLIGYGGQRHRPGDAPGTDARPGAATGSRGHRSRSRRAPPPPRGVASVRTMTSGSSRSTSRFVASMSASSEVHVEPEHGQVGVTCRVFADVRRREPGGMEPDTQQRHHGRHRDQPPGQSGGTASQDQQHDQRQEVAEDRPRHERGSEDPELDVRAAAGRDRLRTTEPARTTRATSAPAYLAGFIVAVPEPVLEPAQPLRLVISSVAAGRTVCRSPTTPKSTSSKIGASSSLFTATIVFEVCMPARCWIAPEMPLAT